VAWRVGDRARRGTSNGCASGSSYDRRARRERLWKRYARRGWIKCWLCPRRMRKRDFEVDRVVCGHDGGRYVDANVRPACRECNRRRCAERCGVGKAAR